MFAVCIQAKKEMHNTFINLYGNHIYSSKLSHHCVIALLGDVDELVLVDLLLHRVLGLGQEATAEGRVIAETRPGHRGQTEHQEAQQTAQAQQ